MYSFMCIFEGIWIYQAIKNDKALLGRTVF